MILDVGEKEYRALPEVNYSRLKDFVNDPRKYYGVWITKDFKVDKAAKKTNEKMIYGSLVDCILTCPMELDYEFLITTATIPTAQTLEFVKSLYKNTLHYSDEKGVLQVDMDFLYDLAWKDSGAKSLDVIKKKFVEKGLEYYTELRNSGDRLVITQSTYEKAERLVQKLREHPYSSGLINLVSNERFTVKDQLVLTGEINGIEVKGKLDKCVFDEKNKIIQPWDIKCSDGDEAFLYNYTNLYYYLQKAMYTLLVRQNYPEYEVRPMSFLSVDRNMYLAPMKFKASEKSLEQALKGFKKEGRSYPGLYEIIEDYKFYHEHNCFIDGRRAYENAGNIDIEIFEDK